MSITYLKHPIHGAEVATMDLEVEADLANGWVVFDPNEPEVEAPAAEAEPAAEPVNQLSAPRKGRRRNQEG
jgi:hypothetical protein